MFNVSKISRRHKNTSQNLVRNNCRILKYIRLCQDLLTKYILRLLNKINHINLWSMSKYL